MNKMLFILARDGKFKVKISRHVTFRFAILEKKIIVAIDNHLTDDKGQRINHNKYIDVLNTGKQLQGYLDVPEVRAEVDSLYAEKLAYYQNAQEAKTDFEYFIQWDNNTCDRQKELAERVAKLVAGGHRVQIAPDKVLILSDTNNKGVQNVFDQLHVALVKIWSTDLEIKKKYENLCTEEVYSSLRESIMKYGDKIETFLETKENEFENQQFKQLKSYESLKSRYVKNEKEKQ